MDQVLLFPRCCESFLPHRSPSCMTDYSHHSFRLLFKLVYSSFYLPEQMIRPPRLCASAFPPHLCYLSAVLITKGDHPLSSSAQSEHPLPRWLMSLRRGLSPCWQLLLSRNILMARLWTKEVARRRTLPPSSAAVPIARCSSLVFLKCQRQSRIGQDNKHLNKALSLINERWWGRGGPPTALCR